MPAAKKPFRNRLNNLDPKAWLKFQKSWFVHNPPPRKKGVLQHPAKFPETLAQEFIEFFTKRGQTVLDPMVGTGSTLVACLRSGRHGIGIELNPAYVRIAEQILAEERAALGKAAAKTQVEIIEGDAARIVGLHLPPIDYVLTCYDDQTEILTEDGWRLFSDLRAGVKVATLEEGQFLRFREPLRIVREPYDGPMYSIQTRAIDIKVTLNHNLYVRARRSSKGFRLMPACEVMGREVEYKLDAEWEGEDRANFHLPGLTVGSKDRDRIMEYPAREVPMDAWLEFLGYWLTEGSVSPRGYAVDLATADPHLAERFKAAVSAIGERPRLYQGEQAYHLKFSSPAISTWLAPLGHADQKYIPREFLCLSRRQLRILFDAMMAGDGDQVEGGRFWTSSERLKDDFQELLLKIGYAGTCQVRDRRAHVHTSPHGNPIRHNFRSWCVGIWKERLAPRVSVGYCAKANPRTQASEEVTWYQGQVYCVQVPSGIVYVRRNGKGVWCGNSPPYWDMLRMRGAETQKRRRGSAGLDVFYSDDPHDLGNIADYDEFVERLACIYEGLRPLLKDRAYLTIIVKNVKKGGKIYPLAWDLAQRLRRTYTLKDEKVWVQNDIRLAPYGLGNAWVSNTFHHYCLQFRKEDE